MKKIIMVLLAVLLIAAPVAASAQAKGKDAGAATLLSRMIPGAGEWYNNDFRGSFPWGECIVGSICCLVALSSVFDAAAGKTDTKMRLDFWTPPSR